MSHIDLDDAEKIKTLIVEPTVQALRQEIVAQLAPLLKTSDSHEGRIGTLEGTQKKAMAAYAVMAVGASAAVTASWNWLKSKVHLG